MSTLRDRLPRRFVRESAPASGPAPAAVPPSATGHANTAAAAAAPPAKRPGVAKVELERRRERVARELAEEQWDLGGLAYEMAIRDHYRLDVLTRKAARLQELDAQLAALERLIKMESEGAAGACGQCGAFYARGAAFCWQCGAALTETLPAR